MSSEECMSPMISYAQNFEDVMLQRVFKGQSSGFYIDIGVWDATIDSVTRHFYDQGWRGINVEPLPDNYRKILAERPRDINLNVAISSCPGSLAFHHVHNTGLSTSRDDYARMHAEKGFEVSELVVPTKTLKEICDDHAVGVVIDFLKIDVEGAEVDVIRSGDWRLYRPRVVLVESVIPNSPVASFSEWEPALLENGYVFVYFDGLNRFYLREEDLHFREAFYAPPNVFDEFVIFRIEVMKKEMSRLRERLNSAMKSMDENEKFRGSFFGKVAYKAFMFFS
ncbi:MAG: FkbM family methyltransferase [Pseudomonadales bacterium]|nr:FkbM family methyltransferase [Pseudomonadales bacterium]MCC6530664.1 FkbM family methyltransferase [Pseudomonadales bacterium]MCP5332525.1 FkbM family methyltransferase [Pseudomonadales bacterium]